MWKCPLFRLLSCLCSGILHFAIFRFKYNCFYELDSLAVVNVRDLGGIKHTFKLLVPEARLFQCANAEAKKVSGATSVSLYVVSVVHFSPAASHDANDDFYWLIQIWMDSFERAKNVKKELEAAQAMQRRETMTKRWVWPLFSWKWHLYVLLKYILT